MFGVNYTSYQVILLPLVALLTLLGLRYFLRRTLAGAVILAVTEDREAATAIGIDARRVYLVTFVIGASFAALGGALASPTTSLVPGMGADMIVLSFAVAATAGLGQIEGTALTALMIGLARAFIDLYPAGIRGAGAVSASWCWCCWCGRRACSARSQRAGRSDDRPSQARSLAGRRRDRFGGHRRLAPLVCAELVPR